MADAYETVGPNEPAPAPALGPEDFAFLKGMLLSQDASERDRAVKLSQKFTPDEHKAFSAWAERNRSDNSVLGVPPEVAVTGGIGVGGAMAANGLSAGGRVAAGVRSLASLGVGVVKYDVAKSVLEAAGLPSPLSDMAAMAIAGYRRRGASAAAETASPETSAAPQPHLDLSGRVPAGGLTQQQIGERLAAARASGVRVPMSEPVARPQITPSSPQPVAAAPAQPVAAPAPAQPTAPAEAPVTPAAKLSPQQTLNELAIAARRAKTTLSPAEYDALKLVVADGTSPADAVAALVKSRIEANPAAELARRLGTPSDAERTFPPNKSGLPSRPPRATKR